jgi:predicted  nucleic acid-binding Zn-ribbon protein
MLSTPKKGARKNEPSAPSETASFKKVAYGFSPDEVNLYLHSLRKKNLELQNENDALTAAHDPDVAIKMENLERNLSEANERYLKEKELTTMLEVECGRLGEELDKLTNQMSESGSDAEQMKAKVAKAEAKAQEAEINVAKAEAKVVDAEANFAEANANLNKAQNKLAEFENRATEYQTIIAEYEKKLKEHEASISEYEAKLAQALTAAPAAAAPAAAVDNDSYDDMVLGEIPDLDLEIPEFGELDELEAAPPPAAKPAAKKAAPVPRAASEVDLDFAEFQVPSADAPIFEEAPELGEGGLADKLSTMLAEIEDLKSSISKAKEAEAAELEAAEKKKKKSKKEEDSINNARLSRAELKIQIFQEEAEDSYIIPEKYLKMIEDVEAQDEDDDFSYLLTDTNPLDEMAIADDDDDMNSFMVAPPVATKAPPPAPAAAAPRRAVPPSPNSPPPPPATSSIRSAPRPAPARPDVAAPDPGFAAEMNRNFKAAQPKGDNIAPRNPAIKERGADLKPRNPLRVERGADLGEDLLELRVGESSNPNKNIRPRKEENVGYDFMLETDDSDMI